MSTLLFVDVEEAMRRWLRTHALLTTALSGRVYFGTPEGNPTTPFVTLARIGGAPQLGEAPVEDVRVSFTVWSGNKKTSSDVARALVQALHQMNNETLSDEVHGYGATVDSVLFLATDVKYPRYVVDSTITVRGIAE